jgi:Fe2+ transport system protein FeoA
MTAETNLTLADLPLGGVATVTKLTSAGVERRRMMDLGILPGAKIKIAMTNPLGDPTAYDIRGAVIALRQEQTQRIEVSIDPSPEDDAQ